MYKTYFNMLSDTLFELYEKLKKGIKHFIIKSSWKVIGGLFNQILIKKAK